MEGLRMIFTPFTCSATTITPVLLKWNVLAERSRLLKQGILKGEVSLPLISCLTGLD
jgi:hypothetical protein